MDEKLGPTGNFPKGKLEDKGELAVGFTVDHEQRVIFQNFGTMLSWVALDSATARLVGRKLIDMADELDLAAKIRKDAN